MLLKFRLLLLAMYFKAKLRSDMKYGDELTRQEWMEWREGEDDR